MAKTKTTRPPKADLPHKPIAAVPFAPPSWPGMKIDVRKIADLRRNPLNAKTHPPEQITALRASLREFGWVMPMAIDEKGLLLAGHARLEAGEQEGIEEAPCVIARGWSDDKKRAYMLADNRLAEMAAWDVEARRRELLHLRSVDYDLTPIGFDLVTLNEFVTLPNPGAGVDPDAVPEPAAIAVSRLRDVWLLGDHRLVCGDCTDSAVVAAVLNGEKPHLMVTDPPYGVEYDPDWRNRADRANGKPYGARAIGKVQNDDQMDWSLAWTLFGGDVVYCWHAHRQASIVQSSLEKSGFEIVSQVIWAKDRLILSRGDYHWQHEPCWYAVRKGKKHNWHGDRSQTTLWTISHAKSETGHSTQKPVECMARPMRNNSRQGDAVYEPFCGSGTSIIAAEMLGRRCLAIELNPIYIDLAVRRWEEFTKKAATLSGSGQTFGEVERARSKRPRSTG